MRCGASAILTEQFSGWMRQLGGLTGLGFLQTLDLSSSKFMIYGLALVLMMMLRPEGIFPSRQRRAELHGAAQAEPLHPEGAG